MQLLPLFDRVLIRPIDDEAPTTSGGLVVPQVALGKRDYEYGEVIGVGKGRHDMQGNLVRMTIKVGDIVMYPRNAGTRAPHPAADGRERVMVIMREPDVLAIAKDLPRASSIVGLDGDLLRMAPQSSALPDSVDKNLDDFARAKFDLKDAPPDVQAELAAMEQE